MNEARRRHSMLQIVREFLRRLLGRKPLPPGDPYADRLVPVRRGPKGRSGTAVAEPDEDADFYFPPRKQ